MEFDDICPECHKNIKQGQRIIVLAPEDGADELDESVIHYGCFARSYEKVADIRPN